MIYKIKYILITFVGCCYRLYNMQLHRKTKMSVYFNQSYSLIRYPNFYTIIYSYIIINASLITNRD